jgi:hypothetical protein
MASSSLSLEPSLETNDSFNVFASVRGARDKDGAGVDQTWRQYTVKPLDSMAQLLSLALAKIGADVDELQNYPTLVTCHKTWEAELAGRVDSDLSQNCQGVLSDGYLYIQFHIVIDNKPSTPFALGDADEELMMSAPRCLPDCKCGAHTVSYAPKVGRGRWVLPRLLIKKWGRKHAQK